MKETGTQKACGQVVTVLRTGHQRTWAASQVNEQPFQDGTAHPSEGGVWKRRPKDFALNSAGQLTRLALDPSRERKP